MAMKKGKREVVPEKSVSKRTSPKGNVPKESAEKGKGEESKDDDEYLYKNFAKFKTILVRRECYTDQFFVNSDHKDRFETLKERGIMPHRVFDLNYLESVGILLKMHLKNCKLDYFVERKAPIYPDLVAYFYSTLSFFNANSLYYKIGDKFCYLRDNELAHIMGSNTESLLLSISSRRRLLDIGQGKIISPEIPRHILPMMIFP